MCRKEEKERNRIAFFFAFALYFISCQSIHPYHCYTFMIITRGLLLFLRKYSKLCLTLTCLWMVVFSFDFHFTSHSSSSSSPSKRHNNNDIYSYFQHKSSRWHNTSRVITNEDVLLIIRTSKNTQNQRIPVILRTWFQFSPTTTYITTNGNKTFFHQYLPEKYYHQLYSSDCKQAHSIRDLCCNSASEFEIYFRHEKRYKWLCRFDDDQYVNVPLLFDYLDQFVPEKQALYIGKPSMKEPKQGRGLQFWFATYGGGVCFSRLLLEKIRKDIQPNYRFIEGCVASNYPDDTHIAYLLRQSYNINLTVAEDFHHHIELDLFTNLTNPSNIDRAITLGFKGNNVPHFLPLVKDDTYHMQTLHCLLYPDRTCMRLLRILLNKLYDEKKV